MCLLPKDILNIFRKQSENEAKVKRLIAEHEAAVAGAPIEPLDAGLKRTLDRRYRRPMPSIENRRTASSMASYSSSEPQPPAFITVPTVSYDPPASSDYSSSGGDFGGGGSDASF